MVRSSFYRLVYSSLRLKSHPFSFTTTIPLTTSSNVERFYTHLVNHAQNPEKTLVRIRAQLDAQSVRGVLHRCHLDKPQLGLRFFFWAGLQPGYRHSRYMYSLACKLFKIEKNPTIITEVLEAYRVEGCVADVKLFKVLLNLCKEALLADEALGVLRRMEGFSCRPDSTMFNVVIRLFCEKGDLDMVMGLAKEMKGRDLYPDMITYMLILKGLCNAGRMEDACRLFMVMRSHGCTPNLVAYSALLDGLCNSGAFEKVLELLEEMEKEGGERTPNVITYTSVIHRFCEKGKSVDALPILDRMKSSKCSPNRVTMSVLIEGLCTEGYIDEAYKLIDRIVAEGHASNGECYSSLVIALLRNKRVEEAEKLFQWMLANSVRPDGLACSILMQDLCLEGKFLDAFNLYEDVEKAGHVLTMDTEVFSALLFGLCHQNHDVEVAKLVSLMVEKGYQTKAPYMQAIKEQLKGCVDIGLLSKLSKLKSGC